MANYTLLGYEYRPTSVEALKTYAPFFYGLRHIRTGPGYDGIMLFDTVHGKEVVVAILQCRFDNQSIQALEVAPAYRRKGIATALLEKARNDFGCDTLTVRENNHPAIALYKRNEYWIEGVSGVMLQMRHRSPHAVQFTPPPGVTTPESLYRWMTSHLQYEGKVKGYLLTATELPFVKHCHCWESSEFALATLGYLGFQCHVVFAANRAGTATHTAVIYHEDGELVWFEWAWKRCEGLHCFKNAHDFFDTFAAEFKKDNGDIKEFTHSFGHVFQPKDNEAECFKRMASWRAVKLTPAIQTMSW